MNEMLKPGQRCDLTCFCDGNRLHDYKTYYLVRFNGGTVTACEECGSNALRMAGWKRIRLYVKDGRPVNPVTTKVKRHG